MDTVKNIGSHEVDLADGRSLGPGDWAEDVDLEDERNAALLDEGFLSKASVAEAPSKVPEVPLADQPKVPEVLPATTTEEPMS